jgi:hypothetical protein
LYTEVSYQKLSSITDYGSTILSSCLAGLHQEMSGAGLWFGAGEQVKYGCQGYR